MTDGQPLSGRELRSEVTSQGQLRLTLPLSEVRTPEPNEIVVRIEASPLNPSDLGLLLAAADMSTAKREGDAEKPVVVAAIPATRLQAFSARFDEPLPVGNEGAGIVVRAGREVQSLIGKTVALQGGGMYADYRVVNARDAVVLPDGVTAAEGASVFINPMTALGMVETMKREGHSALVHTAAASNLGQMLNRLCQKDSVGLVNIVRSSEQAILLRDAGATFVVDSTAPTFMDDLTDAIVQTGATLAFDAIGGGELAGKILLAMEAALRRTATSYSRYGTQTHKQVYVYGGLDVHPTVIDRSIGMAWGIGGWLVMWFLETIGPDAARALQVRVLDEIRTTFASRYTAEISLHETLNLDMIAAYNRRATGEKYLINPHKTAA